MDKSWIALGSTVDGRLSQPYYDGVISFLRFAMAVIDRDGKILCPCRKCVNVVRQKFQIVQIHLLQHGIIPTYTIWHVHGEPRESNEAHHHDIPVEGNEVLGGIDALVEDRIRGESTNTTQEEEVRTFDKLLNDAKREVYPGCTNYTLLKFVIEVLNMKVTNHWSNKSVDMMLEFLTKLLPKDNLVPKSTYEAKKILRELGLSPECEKNYDDMMKIQAEHCSQPGVVPLTPEELSVKVLKPRSGYVKGLGLRPSFSVRTTSASTDSDYVRRLEMEIQEQKGEIQSQKEEIQSQKEEITTQKHEIQAQKEEIQAQKNVIGKMNESIEENLSVTSSIMEFLRKQGFKGQFRGGGIP